jgi:hypothetical protein
LGLKIVSGNPYFYDTALEHFPKFKDSVRLYLFEKPLNPPSSPFFKGGQGQILIKSLGKSFPPFVKGRTGGI